MKVLYLLALVALSINAEKRRFDNYKVLEITANNEAELKTLHALKDKVDFWKDTNKVGRPAHIMVTPQQFDMIRQLFPTHKVLCDNVQELVDREAADMAKRRVYEVGMPSKLFQVDQYHTYQEITDWLAQLQTEYPDLATVIDLGTTFDNNDLKMIKIGKSTGSKKNGMWIDANIHAREWAAGSTAVWIINELLTNYATNPTYKNYVDTIDFYIVPILNPDGYIYSHTTDRQWRKTRSKNCALLTCCYGVDPNRNWPYEWDVSGASNSPCSDEYAGPKAASELIVQHAMSYLTAHAEIKGYMTIHTYSQMWFYPYAYKADTYPSNINELKQMSASAVAAIKAVHGQTYQYGSPADILYDASGCSFDWTANPGAGAGIPYSFGAELRPQDGSFYGFELPANQIVPTAEEFWAGIEIIVQKVLTA